MTTGNRPSHRITVRNANTRQEMTIGKLWPSGRDDDDGTMSISLGEPAYDGRGDPSRARPEVTRKQAMDLLFKSLEKGSGYFNNVRPIESQAERAARQAQRQAEDAGTAEEAEDLPF